MTRPAVLVFAGLDPSGGAGLQADIQAISALGAHALPVATALTVQDNNRVFAVHPVADSLLREQAQPLLDRIDIAAVKVGIAASRANAEAIAGIVRHLRQRQPELPVVLDPVLASGHGDALAVGDPVDNLERLLPLATLVTPNLPEAARLCAGEPDRTRQAASLLARGAGHVLLKGGHGDEPGHVLNRWFGPRGDRCWTWPRLDATFHGSGCTLAAAIAALLARGMAMEQALDLGQRYCQEALAASYAIAPGQRIPERSPLFPGFQQVAGA